MCLALISRRSCQQSCNLLSCEISCLFKKQLLLPQPPNEGLEALLIASFTAGRAATPPIGISGLISFQVQRPLERKP